MAEPAPPPGPEDAQRQKGTIQPKDEVGTRKGFRRYRWEFKDSNKEFWTMGHAEVKILCLVSWIVILGVSMDGRAVEVGENPCNSSEICIFPPRVA